MTVCRLIKLLYFADNKSQRKSNESGSINNATNITTQTQPFIQSSPQLQSVQQSEYDQRRHIKPQANDRSEPTTRSATREARPTGARRKD